MRILPSLDSSRVYLFLDYTPFISPIKNLVDIYIKTVVRPEIALKPSPYTVHLFSKSLSKCVFLLAAGTLSSLIFWHVAKRYFKQQEEDPELNRLQKLAKGGSVEHLIELGKYYLNAQVGINFQEAIKWFKIASENGSNDAKFILACLEYEGNGFPRNESAAIQILKELANQNHGSSCFMLGEMSGSNDSEFWFKKGAEMGHMDSIHAYALLLKSKSPLEASKWFREGACEGHIGCMYEYGLSLKESAPEAAKDWLKKCAVQEHLEAIFAYGELLDPSNPKEIEEVVNFYLKAIENGQEEAEKKLLELAERLEKLPYCENTLDLLRAIHFVYSKLNNVEKKHYWLGKILVLSRLHASQA